MLLSVRVTDGAATATASVEITVTDVNDNAPQFRPDSQDLNLTVSEGEPVDFVVATVTADDVDSGANGQFE